MSVEVSVVIPVRDGADTIRIVQLSDFAIGTLTTPARLVPGDPPWRAIVAGEWYVDRAAADRFALESHRRAAAAARAAASDDAAVAAVQRLMTTTIAGAQPR